MSTHKQNRIILLILGLSLFLISIFLPHYFVEEMNSIKVSNAEKELHRKEMLSKQLLVEMTTIKEKSEEELEQFSQHLQDLYKSEGLAFYALHNDQFIFWSDDAVAFDKDSIFKKGKVQKLGNGWYEVNVLHHHGYSYISLIQIYRCYDHENQYLEPGINEDFDLGESYNFTITKRKHVVSSKDGEKLFFVEILKENEIPAPFCYFYNLLFLTSVLLILYCFSFIPSGVWSYIFSILFLLGLRISMLFFSFPESMLQLEFFGPRWYEGTFWIPSFGDLFLHAILMLFIAYFLKQWIKSLSDTAKTAFYLLPFILFAFTAFLLYLMVSLLQNSEFELNLNNLLQLNFYSYLGLTMIAILVFSSFILADASLRALKQRFGSGRATWLLLIPFAFFFLLLLLIEDYYAFYFLGFILPLLLIYTKGIRRKNYSLPVSLVLLLSFSAISAFIIHREDTKKELRVRKDAISAFSEEEDPIAEFLFAELQKKLIRDTIAHQLLSEYWKNENKVVDYLENKYFNTYWEKFEVFFTPCFVGDSLMIAPNNIEVDCIEFFRHRIQNEGKSVSTSNLFQLDNNNGKISYLAEIPILYQGREFYLYIEIYTRPFNNNNGYPELLLDKREINKAIDLDEYSFAIYNKKLLVNSAGDFSYSLHWNTRLPDKNRTEQMEYGGYNHLLFLNRDHTMFVLSKKKESLFNYLTSLSYLLTFLSILLIPFSYLIPDFPIRIKLSNSDFTGRLHLFIIGLLFTTLVLFVISTSYFIQEQYYDKNVKAIGDKMRSVMIEIEQELSAQNDLGQNFQDYVTFVLIKLSNVFYTDINLYRPDGILYASSRPEIFESGLKARRMDPQAVHQMILNHKTEFIQEEGIGSMKYLSAYKPFRNNANKLVAYLNLPYFAKQNQLEKEISAFLVSTINLYVIIFVLAILISVFIVNQLSKPLRLIRSKIRKLRLGASNELIQWESNDEIGSLVKEYNRMVVELGENVEQLARSERESAWREMAKQVAHEIKNPLTPMKLSIQHLKRAYYDKSEDLDARVERTTQTLIEQIDTLAGIANEFSNFANMPEVKKEEVDLLKSISTAANLYREKDKIDIHLQSTYETAYVFANKDHILRVFNNLVKNAVQAIPENRKGLIEIVISTELNFWKVDIQDNGVGIPAEQIEKIFTPNFTTKTGGMGLGLAMVKTIMDSLNGKISFESQEGKGTVFHLMFPKSNAS